MSTLAGIPKQTEARTPVRVLALNRQKHFADCNDCEQVQRTFFERKLPVVRNGLYRYDNLGLAAKAGTRVLFACDGKIIASAVFVKREKSPDGRGGTLRFDPASIRLFDPVGPDHLRQYWPNVRNLDRTKYKLDPEKYATFEASLNNLRPPSMFIEPDDAEESLAGEADYSPTEIDDRLRVLRHILQRRGQKKFRSQLMERYGTRCMITGCVIADIIEAAHIRPYRSEDDNHPDNGLLLRPDIHTLFDLHLLAIHPERLSVELHPKIRAEYGDFADLKVNCTEDCRPSREALELHYEEFQDKIKP